MNTEATLLTGKVETPKRALALKLVLAICALTALVGAIATLHPARGHVLGLSGERRAVARAPVDCGSCQADAAAVPDLAELQGRDDLL